MDKEGGGGGGGSSSVDVSGLRGRFCPNETVQDDATSFGNGCGSAEDNSIGVNNDAPFVVTVVDDFLLPLLVVVVCCDFSCNFNFTTLSSSLEGHNFMYGPPSSSVAKDVLQTGHTVFREEERVLLRVST